MVLDILFHLLGVLLGVVIGIVFFFPVFIKQFIKDNCGKTLAEKIDGEVYFLKISNDMTPSKLRHEQETNKSGETGVT